MASCGINSDDIASRGMSIDRATDQDRRLRTDGVLTRVLLREITREGVDTVESRFYVAELTGVNIWVVFQPPP